MKNDLLIEIERLEAQFAGYAMRLAPADFGNDIIFGTIDKIRAAATAASTCLCCDSTLTLYATDDPEVSRCSRCGMPYWDTARPAVSPKWVAFARDYWDRYHLIVFPADYQIVTVTYAGVGLRDCTESEILTWNREILEQEILEQEILEQETL